MSDPVFVLPDWPAAPTVHAACSTRVGGVSDPPFESFNLGSGAGDEPAAVAENRRRLRAALDLPGEPAWLRQVHGNRVVQLDEGTATPARERRLGPRSGIETSRESTVVPAKTGTWGRADDRTEADAAWTDRPGAVCAVLTADCLPVLLCSRDGTAVAAVHCGWRGLAAGVLTAAIEAMPAAPGDLLAWLGPAIGPDAYEVGPEVREAFLERHEAIAPAFRPSPRWNHFYCDLCAIAHIELHTAGVRAVYGGGFCTYSDRARFFSYRGEGQTGRMATLIWINGMVGN